MVDDYDRLFSNEMETQRKRFESQLEEAKSKKERSISEAVEKALASRMQDIQSKLEHYDDVAVVSSPRPSSLSPCFFPSGFASGKLISRHINVLCKDKKSWRKWSRKRRRGKCRTGVWNCDG
ncbi:uncharacterized protein LOC131331434 [Rhododendron vialii]|uniref:uncharacterized protein LOC131331434 n=1 Tax=Rhododendron vialii TaxID=182163 RepID=UPI00265F86F9|nr:uncharacterized protein LOC131331434 [Rhododendron vialii]